MEWQIKTRCTYILVTWLVCMGVKEVMCRNQTFYALRDLEMLTFMKVFNSSSDIQCGRYCLYENNCVSFGITPSTGVCKLFDTDALIAPSNSTTMIGSILYIKDCEKDWLRFGDSCYKFTKTSKSWVKSKTYCESLGAGLSIVTYEEEHQFIRQIANGTGKPFLWIGGRYDATARGFRWIDGTEMTFDGWKPEYPVATATSGCVDYVENKNWLWNHHGNCYSTLGACICEKKRI